MGVKIRMLAIFGGLCAAVCSASGDGNGPPGWSLTKSDYDSEGSAAMLLPSNDTRVNLLLLLADRRGVAVRDPRAKVQEPPLVLFPWSVMEEAARAPEARQAPQQDAVSTTETKCQSNSDGSASCTVQEQSNPADGDWNEPSRCQSNGRGTAEFIDAVQASRGMPEAEKTMLIAARQGIAPAMHKVQPDSYDEDCGARPLPPSLAQVTSVEGREFSSYLSAARAFYSGDFQLAIEDFRSLGSRNTPWVREAASYMVGRAEMDLAVSRSIDQYGSVDPKQRDPATIASAEAAFDAYLNAYPNGRYASSARGLKRRLYWLAGNQNALAAEYGGQLETKRLDGPDSYLDLIDEIDNKLPLPTNSPQAVRDPLLLAVVDLHRMRQPAAPDDRKDCCGPAITAEEIERQRPLFGGDTELFDYIRAAEAYFVRHQPREVLQLIPDAAHQKRFTYVQFSRQMLRGLALQDVGDRNSRAFFISLFPGATQPYQRGALELALAIEEEKSGRLDLVFAPDSEVRHPIIREMLLEHTAGPDILRQQATRSGVPKLEREVALYILLSKELRHGLYPDFVRDIPLLPADAKSDGYFAGALGYEPDIDGSEQRPPLERFGHKAALGNEGCPAIAATAATLAADPRAIRPRLCLAEYFRLNGFDDFDGWYSFDKPVEGNGLASTPPLFPGDGYDRLQVYRSIIADPAATADEKGWALNRAIRCYAPSGNNSCGRTEVDVAQRRAWFNRLKADYPGSRWAKDLKFYW